MKANSSRSVLQGLAGAYLLYLAYQLVKNLTGSVETSMPRWVAILAAAAFAGIGVTFLISAWKIWKKSRADQDEHPVELEKENDETGAGQEDSGK